MAPERRQLFKVKAVLSNESTLLHDGLILVLKTQQVVQWSPERSAMHRRASQEIIPASGTHAVWTPHSQCLTLTGPSGSELCSAVTSHCLFILALCTVHFLCLILYMLHVCLFAVFIFLLPHFLYIVFLRFIAFSYFTSSCCRNKKLFILWINKGSMILIFNF